MDRLSRHNLDCLSGPNRPISVLYAQLSPRPKHCGQTLPDGKLFFFLFLSGAEESASCVVFQRPCPAGIGDRVLLYQTLIFVITFPLALGLSRGCPPTWRTALCISCVCSGSHITPSPSSVSSRRVLLNAGAPTLFILFKFFFAPLPSGSAPLLLAGNCFKRLQLHERVKLMPHYGACSITQTITAGIRSSFILNGVGYTIQNINSAHGDLEVI